MVITENTKISQLIKENPQAIEAIASISGHFSKLRNPLLRKILASRVTIKEAAQIGGSSIGEFFRKLSPLGFEFENKGLLEESQSQTMKNEKLRTYNKELDVREDLLEGNDPFQKIMKAVSALNDGDTLRLVNTFEPIPLIKILEKKGYHIEVDKLQKDLVYTYFQKGTTEVQEKESPKTPLVDSEFFNAKLKKVKGLVESLDVRNMEMPLPMVTVLEKLEHLDDEDALFVHHFKIPHFLLEELHSRGYAYLINEEGKDIYLLINKEA